MSAVVLDSCVMQHFTKSVIAGQPSPERALIGCIEEHHKFAMDDGDKMNHQWLETCGQVFREFLIKWLLEGKVQFYPAKLHEHHRKHLTNNCGFPFTQRHEGVFVSVATVASSRILVSDDIDFWDPTEKLCTPLRRREIMEESKGAVCRYLRKELNVQVVTVDQALQLLCPGGE